MSPVIALILQYIGWTVLLLILVVCLFDAAFDYFHPPGPDEIARREAERAAKQASMEAKKRMRMRVVRFWNF